MASLEKRWESSRLPGCIKNSVPRLFDFKIIWNQIKIPTKRLLSKISQIVYFLKNLEYPNDEGFFQYLNRTCIETLISTKQNEKQFERYFRRKCTFTRISSTKTALKWA